MFYKIRKWNETRKNRNVMKDLIAAQFCDYLAAETAAKEAEKKAYESMTVFGETFKPEDLQKMLGDVDKIANSPDLSENYYSQVSRQAHEQKMAEWKAVK